MKKRKKNTCVRTHNHMHIQIANAMMQFHIYSQYMLYLTIYIHVEKYVENTSLEREREKKRDIYGCKYI